MALSDVRRDALLRVLTGWDTGEIFFPKKKVSPNLSNKKAIREGNRRYVECFPLFVGWTDYTPRGMAAANVSGHSPLFGKRKGFRNKIIKRC